MAELFPVDNQHQDDQDHCPEAKNYLDFAQKMPDPGVGGLDMRQSFEKFCRKSVNYRDAEQDRSNELNSVGVHSLPADELIEFDHVAENRPQAHDAGIDDQSLTIFPLNTRVRVMPLSTASGNLRGANK